MLQKIFRPNDKQLTTPQDVDQAFENMVIGIANKYHYLSEEERENLTIAMLDEIGHRLDNGEELAFVKPMPDGKTAKLTIFELELMNNLKDELHNQS